MLNVTNNRIVPYTTEDRQWDARFNVPTDAYLNKIIESAKSLCVSGRFRYCLVSGVEIGTRPTQNDFGVQHVHCCFIAANRISKGSLLKNLGIIEGHGYYLVPRNRELPYAGWREHHIKEFSKIDPSKPILFEYGELPKDVKVPTAALCAGPEEKKRKLDEILLEMKDMLDEGKDDECFTKFPRNYLMYGERIKAMIHQKRDFFKDHRDPNIWLYGFAGTGKTAILNYIYPKYYKKNLSNRFFDLLDDKQHTHIMLEDLDHEAVERLGINFIKTICDEAGFPIDQKYKTPQLIQKTCLVTSNFTIQEIINGMERTVGMEQNKAALLRRFYHVRIDSLMQLLGLKLIPKWDRVKLNKEGNTDPGRLFISWDYLSDCPTCQPIRSCEDYQTIIRDHYYK